ncbi:MAG TPA: neutral zinc metallopeptidase [Pseudonocardiaceae bacterium]|nr:neutral zinc metallopeptidase [Pseudonocardiaceae bacterium]
MDQVIPLVTQFFRAKYTAMPEPAHYYYIAEGQQMETGCRDQNGKAGIADSTAYEYCPADYNIYLGQARLWQFYNDDGDAAPVVGLAHEWGHNVQARMGVQASGQTEVIRQENQADCIAGAWIQYANEQKWIEPEDVGSIAKLIRDIADAEADPARGHGTIAERGRSLSMGVTGGLAACNAFFPETPIYPTSGS